jgi:hypothetical protein
MAALGLGATEGDTMTDDAKLDRLLQALRAGESVRGSVAEMCALGLAAEDPDLLPAPYDSPGEAWRRLNDEQRLWVRAVNPPAAALAAELAEHATTAWH